MGAEKMQSRAHLPTDDPNFGHWEAIFGRKKSKRRTVGFGKLDKKRKAWSELEIYLRELSIVDAGVGCAVWDAAIIQARWILENENVFAGKQVIELGSGVGLPGLTAAYFAANVVLTDHLPELVDNLKYNIEINSNVEMDGGRLNATKDISKCTTAAYLNWHEIDQPGFDQPELELADIMLGSELTYMEKNVDPLIRVVKKYLKPDGVFYHVLSDDRTGVSTFLRKMEEDGWECHVVPVPERILEVGQFTGQRWETYRLYTFKRPGSPYPVAQ